MILYLYITGIYFFIATIHASSYLPFSKCPKEGSLRKCLDQYRIRGTVNFRDNYFAYSKDLNTEYNRLVIHFPVAFVHPIDVFDVQSTIKCAVKLNWPITARSGGHSFEGYGLGDKDCFLIVDLATLNKITINVTSQTAVVEPGNVLESLYYEVNRYGFAFPAGTCPYVGVGGHITGGGAGLLNRKFGLAADNFLDAQIVLANGTIVHNAKNYPELFWAIRGAGNAGYGIITTLTLRIHPVQEIVTSLSFAYDFDQTPLVFSVLNQLGKNLDKNLFFFMNLNSDFKLSVLGLYLGSVKELKPHIKEFIKLSKPKNVSYVEKDLYNILVDGLEGTKTPGYYKVKSFFIDRQLDNWQCRYYGEAFEKLVEIKRNYDPYNLFHWNQSIPINTKISCN